MKFNKNSIKKMLRKIFEFSLGFRTNSAHKKLFSFLFKNPCFILFYFILFISPSE